MMGNMLGFIIWALVSCLFIGIGISCFFAKKATGFWANSKMFEVNDVKGYNRTMGILWCIFGVIFCVLGIPLLGGQNSPSILVTLVGVMVEVIVFMVVYTLVIERRYRKK